jgi:hypothetical protein
LSKQGRVIHPIYSLLPTEVETGGIGSRRNGSNCVSAK